METCPIKNENILDTSVKYILDNYNIKDESFWKEYAYRNYKLISLPNTIQKWYNYCIWREKGGVLVCTTYQEKIYSTNCVQICMCDNREGNSNFAYLDSDGKVYVCWNKSVRDIVDNRIRSDLLIQKKRLLNIAKLIVKISLCNVEIACISKDDTIYIVDPITLDIKCQHVYIKGILDVFYGINARVFVGKVGDYYIEGSFREDELITLNKHAIKKWIQYDDTCPPLILTHDNTLYNGIIVICNNVKDVQVSEYGEIRVLDINDNLFKIVNNIYHEFITKNVLKILYISNNYTFFIDNNGKLMILEDDMNLNKKDIRLLYKCKNKYVIDAVHTINMYAYIV